jgi:hypothetical protein
MGLNMQTKQAVTKEYSPRYQKATKKKKSGSPGQGGRQAGKTQTEKKRPANRRGEADIYR